MTILYRIDGEIAYQDDAETNEQTFINALKKRLPLVKLKLENIRFTKQHIDLINKEGYFKHININYCRLKNCDFKNLNIGGSFLGSSFEGCDFRDCNIDRTSFNYTKMNKVKFTGCKCSSTEFNRAEMESFLFERTSLDVCDALYCQINGGIFYKCQINDSRFSNSIMGYVNMNNCDIARTELNKVNISNGVLTKNRFNDVRLKDLYSLKNVIEANTFFNTNINDAIYNESNIVNNIYDQSNLNYGKYIFCSYSDNKVENSQFLSTYGEQNTEKNNIYINCNLTKNSNYSVKSSKNKYLVCDMTDYKCGLGNLKENQYDNCIFDRGHMEENVIDDCKFNSDMSKAKFSSCSPHSSSLPAKPKQFEQSEMSPS